MLFFLYAMHPRQQQVINTSHAQPQTDFQKKLFEIQSRLSEIGEQLNKIAQELEAIGKKLNEIGLALDALQQQLLLGQKTSAQSTEYDDGTGGRPRNAFDDRRRIQGQLWIPPGPGRPEERTVSMERFSGSVPASTLPSDPLSFLNRAFNRQAGKTVFGPDNDEDPFANLTSLPPGYVADLGRPFFSRSPSGSGSLSPTSSLSRESKQPDRISRRSYSPPPSVFPSSSFPPRSPGFRVRDESQSVYEKPTSITASELYNKMTFGSGPKDPSGFLDGYDGRFSGFGYPEGAYNVTDNSGSTIGTVEIDGKHRVKININIETNDENAKHLKEIVQRRNNTPSSTPLANLDSQSRNPGPSSSFPGINRQSDWTSSSLPNSFPSSSTSSRYT